jgi:hypothetical protein
MSILPLNRVQCDRCRTVIVLAATKSHDYGAELHAAHWRARRIEGRYQHACNLCADDFLAEAEGRKAVAA